MICQDLFWQWLAPRFNINDLLKRIVVNGKIIYDDYDRMEDNPSRLVELKKSERKILKRATTVIFTSKHLMEVIVKNNFINS